MTPVVCVLLCTYNGEKYLREQLDSLLAQRGVSVKIMAHDDGSSDRTVSILNEYNIPVLGNEHLGAAHGFFYLMEHVPGADYYAFCDQDDIWYDDKLICAIRKMMSIDSGTPVQKSSWDNLSQKPMLYGSGTRLITADGTPIQIHKADPLRTLSSRMFYSSISGNTIVFNRSMKEAAVMYHPEKMVMHDSWMVKLCIAIGGRLIIDKEPHMDYRMHSSNTIGMELNLSQKIRKFKKVIYSKGEGQELIDICSLYGVMVKTEYRRMAVAAEASRTDEKVRKNFMKDHNINFRNKWFNVAFKMKVRKGNL